MRLLRSSSFALLLIGFSCLPCRSLAQVNVLTAHNDNRSTLSLTPRRPRRVSGRAGTRIQSATVQTRRNVIGAWKPPMGLWIWVIE